MLPLSESDRKKPKILNPAHLDFVSGTLVLDQWSGQAIERVFGSETWTWDDRTLTWRAMALDYASIQEHFHPNAYGTLDRVPQWQSVVWSKIQLPELRREQLDAVAAWSSNRRGVIVMPTGTGKTEVAIKIMAEQGCSTLVVAPIRDLMYQWHRRILQGLAYDAGIIGDNVFNQKPVSVTTYDSACIHMPTFGNRFQLIIFDECHHLPGPIRSDAARMSAAPFRLGLTATPERSDGGHARLDQLIGPIVYRLDIAQVRGATLADYEVIRIPVQLNEHERARYDRLAEQVASYVYEKRKEEPSFEWRDLCSESLVSAQSGAILRAYREKQSIEDRAVEKLRVLEDLFRLHAGTPILVFAGSNAMARDVSLQFLIPCLLNHCGKAERLDYLHGLRDRAYPAIVANQVLDEGVDLPEVKIAIVIGGMASTRQAKQRLGRILRRQGNERAILYEVVAQDTNEITKSRKRRRNDAYTRTRNRDV
ncbi:MAG: DEAD/DEAH box helicase [Pirellula sp.]